MGNYIGKRIKTIVVRFLVIGGIVLGSPIALAGLEATEAYLRLPPPGHPVAAAFLHLRNSSADAWELIGVHSKLAKKVEIHTHEHADGVMRMRQIEQLSVPANGEVQLKPGGYHLMVFGLQPGLAIGDTFTLTLLFANGEEIQVEAEARRR